MDGNKKEETYLRPHKSRAEREQVRRDAALQNSRRRDRNVDPSRDGPCSEALPPWSHPSSAQLHHLNQDGSVHLQFKNIVRVALSFLVVLFFVLPVYSADLRVAAASDLNFAIKEIISHYERDTGNHVQLTLGSSGTFFTQISEGAPFDIYLSADRIYAEQLVGKKLDEPGSLFIYGVGRIVVWVPRSSSIDVMKLGMQSLLHASVRKLSIANPDHAPYGRAAVAAMQKTGVFDRVKGKLVLGENISQAAEFVQSGAAQVGIIALSLALSDPMREKGKYWEIPRDFYPVMEQAGVILRRARESGNLDAARSFMRALQSVQSRAILNRYGFTAAQP